MSFFPKWELSRWINYQEEEKKDHEEKLEKKYGNSIKDNVEKKRERFEGIHYKFHVWTLLPLEASLVC